MISEYSLEFSYFKLWIPSRLNPLFKSESEYGVSIRLLVFLSHYAFEIEALSIPQLIHHFSWSFYLRWVLLSESPIFSLNHYFIFIVFLFLSAYLMSRMLYIIRKFAPISLLSIYKRSSFYWLNFKFWSNWRLLSFFNSEPSSVHFIEIRSDSLSFFEVVLNLIYQRVVQIKIKMILENLNLTSILTLI